jgi:hypothetical protein
MGQTTRLTPLAPTPAKGEKEGDGVEISPSRPERRARTIPHLAPTGDSVVHEVQASLPPGRPLMMSGGGGEALGGSGDAGEVDVHWGGKYERQAGSPPRSCSSL